MKYRHYAPRGELTQVEGESRAVVSAIRRLVEEGLVAGWDAVTAYRNIRRAVIISAP